MRLGLKQNETRKKTTNYRGWLAIASTKQIFNPNNYNSSWVKYVESVIDISKLSYGTVHCIVNLYDIVSTDIINYLSQSLTYHEKQWGDYTQKRHVWKTDNLIVLPVPIPVVGRQWLFDWEVPKEFETLLNRK